jgi:hypothetical protein
MPYFSSLYSSINWALLLQSFRGAFIIRSILVEDTLTISIKGDGFNDECGACGVVLDMGGD